MECVVSLIAAFCVAFGFQPDALLKSISKPLTGYVICVDPGHGGQPPSPPFFVYPYTGGAWGVVTCQTESDVNLRVGIRLAYQLEQYGAKIIMTRTSDCRVQCSWSRSQELAMRSAIAQWYNSDIFISVHHDWSNTNPTANFASVYYASDRSKPLAAVVSDSIKRERETLRPKHCNFGVLARSKMPAILVEYSFMSNCQEDCRLANNEYNAKEARTIARGIAYYGLAKKFGLLPGDNKAKDAKKPVKKQWRKRSHR